MGEEGERVVWREEELGDWYLSWMSTRDIEAMIIRGILTWTNTVLEFRHRLKEVDFAFLLDALSNNPL